MLPSESCQKFSVSLNSPGILITSDESANIDRTPAYLKAWIGASVDQEMNDIDITCETSPQHGLCSWTARTYLDLLLDVER